VVAPEKEPIIVVPYDPGWPQEFRHYAARLREALGPLAVRIDHVGSTSVPGLDAKPIVDIQVSVRALEPIDPYRAPIESLGYRLEENDDRTKRAFRWPPGQRRTHLYARAAGSFDEQLNLLFRDYLRTHPEEARGYAKVKWGLAERFRNDREGYVNAKEPTVWAILQRAHTWGQETGWAPGASDA
jgi:GrpB-like predicted nucleotidyltransferase (UPF0157 family)